MKTSKIGFFLVFSCFCMTLFAQKNATISSPNKQILLKVAVAENGNLSYQVSYKNKTIIEPSTLGFALKRPEIMLNKFQLVGVDSSSVDETWKPVWGEVSNIRNNYKQLIVKVKDKSKVRKFIKYCLSEFLMMVWVFDMIFRKNHAIKTFYC